MDHPAHSDGGIQSGSASTADPVSPKTVNNAWDSYDTVFLNAKAGMESVDKKMVQKVVYDMSKGSRYFNNEQRKEAEVLQRIQHMTARAASLTPVEITEHEKATDLRIVELEAARDLSRVWVHVDMDAFYAAVETMVNPSLAGKPMAVGGMSMICTANYEARKFGVRAAMPGFIARKLCPNLIFVRPDFKKYSHYSELTREVFKEYDPDFVARSMDEAYLDITNHCQVFNMSRAEVAEELRKKVYSTTGLTCSAGVGPNRLLAKVCSDINKPNGQYVLGHDRGAVMAFISSLPIRKVCGIGKVTERLLKEVLAITNCADLLTKRSFISALFSQISTEFFLAVGLGIGGSEKPSKEPRKSLSNERTFAAITEERQLFQKLEELVELLADDMEKENLQGRTLTLKLKETGFEVRSRAITLPSFISTKAEIWEHASKLLKGELPLSLRLMGLRISNFKDEKSECSDPRQRTLTSFITRSSTHGGHPATQVSNGPNNIPFSFPDEAHDMPCEACVGDKEYSSRGDSPGKNKQESGHGFIKGAPGCQSCQTVIPLQALSHISPKRDHSRSQQMLSSTILPNTPDNTPTDGVVQTKAKDFMPTFTGLTSMTQRNNSRQSTAQSTALREKSAQVGKGFDAGMYTGVQSRSGGDAECISTNSNGNVCQASLYKDMGEASKAVMIKVDVEDVLDPLSNEEGIKVPREYFSGRITTGFQKESGGFMQARHPTNSVEAAEPTWEALQSGYDSVHEQIWVNVNQCALCGVEVNDCLPSARQEHEDFHFAIWVQQQAEETSGFQRSAITTPPPSKTATRAGMERDSTKRKVSGGRVRHSPHKRSSHLPLEAFFSKSN